MFERAIVLGLYSITPVHAGSGTELSVVDLPIQRERHTGFPVIWGQSLKGVLRRKFESACGKDETIAVFGPNPEDASKHAGAISVGDTKILLFPVRSLKGVFAYVTCPLVLERFERDLKLLDKDLQFNVKVKDDEAFAGSAVTVNSKVVLEDVVLKSLGSVDDNVVKNVSLSLIEEERLKEKLVIVSNDVFRGFVEMCTEIVTRVRIDVETGTVAEGALWTEEFVPSDTMFYSVVAIGRARDGSMDAKEIEKKLIEVFDDTFLQVGGDETVGKGFVRVKVWR